jgi:hypothetical protein
LQPSSQVGFCAFARAVNFERAISMQPNHFVRIE